MTQTSERAKEIGMWKWGHSRRSHDRSGRPIPDWERSVSSLVKALGAATAALAFITAVLVLYARFRDPSSAGAIIGPGVGTLVVSLLWWASWAVLNTMREHDRTFRESFDGGSASGGAH